VGRSDERDRTRRLGSGHYRKECGSGGIVGKDIDNLEAGPLHRRDRRVTGTDAVAALVMVIAGCAVVVRVMVISIELTLYHHRRDTPIPTTEIDQPATRQHPLGNETEEERDGEYGGDGPH